MFSFQLFHVRFGQCLLKLQSQVIITELTPIWLIHSFFIREKCYTTRDRIRWHVSMDSLTPNLIHLFDLIWRLIIIHLKVHVTPNVFFAPYYLSLFILNINVSYEFSYVCCISRFSHESFILSQMVCVYRSIEFCKLKIGRN